MAARVATSTKGAGAGYECSVASAQRPRLLVIDDEPVVGDLLGRVLGEDMEVVVEHEAPRGLERLLEGESFDLVLCDLSMPVISGPQLFERVERHDPELARKMVFITGGSFDEDVDEFLEETTNTVLHKPFTSSELRRTVQNALASR